MTGLNAAALAPVIDVHGLNKFFGEKHVVNDLNLQIWPGEIFGFLGPNGSGKTTSIRLMCGLLTPDSGGGTCLGYDLREGEKIRRSIGYMTQKFSYWDDLTIRENLDFVARVYNLPDRKKLVDETLERLGLSARSGQLVGSLSGGWKQRLALAATMLHSPKLLLLDEPTAGVDPQARRDFWEELHRLAATGISILVSTHYMDEAERCHKLAYLAYGRLLAQGTAAEVIAGQNLFTWKITGPDLLKLSGELRKMPAVAQTVVFGQDLHVSGCDPAAMRDVLAVLPPEYQVAVQDTELEDVFIYLMSLSQDNFTTLS
ncbi:multidrug ABC transporter ATP-binding protein [Deltaproteobacteria bacterium Smac51]|nr:multidrug ABC transporter ATP-binding protein [Deltaproteobacteria bacterium Smac51]